MRKRTIQSDSKSATATIVGKRLDLAQIASVEVTSEQAEFPIESVFAAPPGEWRADSVGEQVIRLLFDEPTPIRSIQLGFVDSRSQRTQEFTLSYAADGEMREIVRQQWTFSPDGCQSEFEDYQVELAAVRTLELRIRPDLQHRQALANLAYWRVHS
ncbi:carbohydrate-binding protein [bacterium]|nr:carbohydrate-binding protein [bacterium]